MIYGVEYEGYVKEARDFVTALRESFWSDCV